MVQNSRMQWNDGGAAPDQSARREKLRRQTGIMLGHVLVGLRPWGAQVRLLAELSVPQLRTMLTVHSTGALRMSDLAARLQVGLPVVTSLVNALEAKDLVTREHTREDRRVVMCSCTETGHLEAEHFWSGLQARVNELVAGLTENELETVARGLELLANAGKLLPAALAEMSVPLQPPPGKGKRTEPPGERGLK